MNAPFERKPSLSLDDGELGDTFRKLPECKGYTERYGATVRDKFEKLKTRLDPKVLDTKNYELGLQQLEGLRDFVWGGLDPVVRLYMPLLEKGRGIELYGENLESWLDLACDEPTIKGHKKLVRRKLEGSTAKKVSLQELANDVYNPKSQKKRNDDWRDKLRLEVIEPMGNLGLWMWFEEMKTSKKNTQYHAGWEITAGPVLMAYHKHVWLPYTELYAAEAIALQLRHFPPPPNPNT
jgi:hypothetical protein